MSAAKHAVLRLATDPKAAHAVLFYGAEGSGKRALAESLAQAWLCKQPSDKGACGECQPCQAFQRARLADFLLVQPKPPSNLIRAGAISPNAPEPAEPTVIEFLRTRPLMALRKVVFIEDADRMNAAAANALLKTLEEPHEYAKLILTTSVIGAVLPTIISRCLCIACELPHPHELMADQDELRAAEGAPGRLAKIRQQEAPYRRMAQFVKDLIGQGPEKALVASESFRAICDDLEQESGSTARAAQVEGLRTLAGLIPDGELKVRWAPPLAEAHRRIIGNGQPGIVFDALFAELLLAKRRE